MTLPKPRKIEVERYEGGLSQFKKIDNPIKLSANESALGPSPRAIEAFEREKNKIFKYPESDCSSLRDIISKKFNIDSERIICGAGSDQIFDLICQLFIEPGDEVVVTEYGFIMYRIYASLYRAKVLLAKEKNFKASVDEIINKVTDKTKIVFIANPNNPTGTYLSKNEMFNLRQRLRSDILLVVDDAYFEFLDKDDFENVQAKVNTNQKRLRLCWRKKQQRKLVRRMYRTQRTDLGFTIPMLYYRLWAVFKKTSMKNITVDLISS